MSIFDIFRQNKNTSEKSQKRDGSQHKTIANQSITEVEPVKAEAEKAPASDSVIGILKRLNCEYKTEEREHSLYILFDYQGGHFRIDASKHNETICIEFPFIYDVEAEQMNLVRTHCNEMNFRARFSKFLYTYDEAKHRIFIHIFTGFNLPEDAEEVNQAFKAILDSHFNLQRDFVAQLEAKLKDVDMKRPIDIEAENVHNRRLLYMLNEQELIHQKLSMTARANSENPITVGQVIQEFYDAEQYVVYGEMRVVTDSLLILDGMEQIKNYSLLAPLLEGEGADARLKCDEATLILKGQNDSLTIQVSAKVDSESCIYFRVNVMCPGLQTNAHKQKGVGIESYSFVVAYDKTSEANHQAEFKYMWEDAKEKLKAKNFGEMTEEQRIICDMEDQNLAIEFYWGKKYFEEKRFYEALKHLEYIYQELNNHFQQLDKGMLDKFYHVCFLIGFCYNEMKLYRKAHFYLDIVFQFHGYLETTEYVNCLVNSKDFRAIYVINGLLDNLQAQEAAAQQASEEEGEEYGNPNEQDHNFLVFRNFLRRRKAYVLIDVGRLDDAEKLCQELLKEPMNADFALGELAYIQRLKQNQLVTPEADQRGAENSLEKEEDGKTASNSTEDSTASSEQPEDKASQSSDSSDKAE